MNESDNRRKPTLPLEVARRLDPICDRFEEDWLAGRRPQLEQYLDWVPQADRSALLRELLALELDYRRHRGEHAEIEEYCQRFPGCDDIIEAAFASLAFSSGEPTPTLHTSPPQVEATVLDAAATEAEPLPQQAGRYQIEGEIGRGGMGMVLRARDPDLNRPLAVKVLLPSHGNQAELERRFREEAEITGQLQHPGIPPIHEIGTLPDGRPFFAMKLIKGQTLAELLRQRRQPSEDLPRLLAIFGQVCQTLAYAHSRGVIHRDLKPSNIMVGAFGEVQVMDWGLAKLLSGGHAETVADSAQLDSTIATVRSAIPEWASRPGTLLGTPAYMAPEQARGEVDQLDERCDVFGLGAILCEMLTGQPPYTGRDGNRLLRQTQHCNLAEAQERLAKCGADDALTALCRACLSVEPDDRPRDAGAVASHVADYHLQVQERLRQAELERVEAETRAREEQARALVEHDRAKAERRAKRWMLALVFTMAAFLVLGIFTSWRIVTEREARAQEFIARQLAEQQNREAARYWRHGRDLDEKGLLKEAIAEFREAIRIYPNYAEAHNYLGVVLSKQGQLDEAIACYKKSIECAPYFPLPYNNLAVALRKKGDISGAIAYYKQAIELDPRSTLAPSNLGVLLYDIGRVEEALAEYRQAARLEPYEGVHHSDLGKCLQRMGQLDEAIREYREAIRLDSDDASYHSSLGNVLEEKDLRDEAIREYRRAIQLYRQEKDSSESIDLANALALLGSALLKQQQWTEAAAVLRECLTIRCKKQPDDWATFDARSLRGAALWGQKKYADAEPLLVQGYEGMKQRETTIPPQSKVRLSEALERLMRFYEATDGNDNAK